MFRNTPAFSGFAVDDIERARQFYSETLGLDVVEEHGMLELRMAQRTKIVVYPKEDHVPATFTILNFPVDDVEVAVDALTAAGVSFIRYDEPGLSTDEKGISRGQGPDIAWFTDPAGNILSVINE